MVWDPDETLRREAKRAGYWVRQFAAERGLSLEALAYESGVARTSVVEMAKRAPSLRTLSSVAAYLEVDVRELLMDIPEGGADPGDETAGPVDETAGPVDETAGPVDETAGPVDETDEPTDR